MIDQDREDKISTIIKHELEITMAVSGGHQPHHEDKYSEKRNIIKKLRIEVFGVIKRSRFQQHN